MKRSDCHNVPIDITLCARMANSIVQYHGLCEAEREMLVDDIGRTIRGIMMDAFVTTAPITFPEHDDIPDLCVTVTLFEGDKLGR